MLNLEIAALFNEMADLLELKGESPFKVRAYRLGATAVGALAVDIAVLVNEGRLQSVPGIGKALAAKAEEYVRTGKINFLDQLRLEIPPSLLELLQIPGIGPKLAMRLYRELGITDLSGLEEAIKLDKLQDMKGFGPKMVKSAARAIAELKMRSGRQPIGLLLPLARELVAAMTQDPGRGSITEAAVAGSLRRHEERAAGIDIVAATKEPMAAGDYLATFTIVERILVRDESCIKLSLHGGISCHVYLVEPEAFISAWHFFTGNKKHVEQLHLLARQQGMEIAGGGTIILPDGSRFLPKDEAEIYDLLNLPFIPPELRSGAGEIEAAIEGRLPDLITAQDMRGDLHVHSNYSDGGWSLNEIVAAACEKGWEYAAVCDHSPLLAMAGGLSREKLAARNEQIRLINQQGGVKLLAGVEVDIRADGSLDYPDDCLAELDIVIASMHTGFQQERARLMERLAKAMYNPYVHIIGHPLGRLLDQRAGFDIDPAEVIRLAAQTGTALEINASPNRLDLPDVYAEMAKDKGVYLAINTDAHDKRELAHMEYGIGLARRAWLEPAHILNCMPLSTLMQHLTKKRRKV